MNCARCKLDLPETDFPIARRTRKRRDICRPCVLRSNAVEWARRHPERKVAQSAVYRAIKSGKLKRPDTCERCGQQKYVIAHHPSYAEKKQLKVEWLCDACHHRHHVAMKSGRTKKHDRALEMLARHIETVNI